MSLIWRGFGVEMVLWKLQRPGMYGPDAFCKLLFPDVETVCMHVSGLPLGDLPKHARSLDEIRTFCP